MRAQAVFLSNCLKQFDKSILHSENLQVHLVLFSTFKKILSLESSFYLLKNKERHVEYIAAIESRNSQNVWEWISDLLDGILPYLKDDIAPKPQPSGLFTHRPSFSSVDHVDTGEHGSQLQVG
ncbi:MAG: hypothetical protein GKR77_03605 [Legionellales bacterium]|nr:hypothetical protein [Legionellales bacterium]